jgi:hypothetical protein
MNPFFAIFVIMRKWKFIIFCITLFSLKISFAQVFSVGNTCCNYNLVNKTFTVNSTPCANPPIDYYAFDIDGDVAPDIKVSSFGSPPCFAGGVTQREIMVTTTTNCEFVYSTAITCPYRYFLNLTFGTPFTASLNWSVTPSSWSIGQASPYVYYEYINPSSFSYTCNVQANPFYVGFRKILPFNDTIYGWIRMDSNFPGKLIDYAFMHTSLTASLNETVNNKQFSLFPNPNSGEFEIKGTKEESIFVSNELGQLIKIVELGSNNNYTSKITELQGGVYFIGNNSTRQKVVVIK